MNYQSGDRLKNRYLSNDAFTSLKNKLGGRSITSLGNRRKGGYKVINQGFDMFDFKTVLYRIFVIISLLIILMYAIPQTRYFIHGFTSQKIDMLKDDVNISLRSIDNTAAYSVAPVFMKTDEFVSRQKIENIINEGSYVYDFFTENLIGISVKSSSSTIGIRLFSDAGFKNNLLIEQGDKFNNQIELDFVPLATTTNEITQEMENISNTSDVFKQNNITYSSYVFEGSGYGQLVAKVPPKTEVKKDSLIYIRTVDGLKPVAKIINIDEDNKSTFTIIYAQLIIPPQNIYKVIFK